LDPAQRGGGRWGFGGRGREEGEKWAGGRAGRQAEEEERRAHRISPLPVGGRPVGFPPHKWEGAEVDETWRGVRRREVTAEGSRVAAVVGSRKG
jgi:hypothetical protein